MSEIPVRRIRESEIRNLFRMFAAWDALEKASEDDFFVNRLKSIPGAWRDVRMICSRIEAIIGKLKLTIPPEKRNGISRSMERMRFSLSQGAVASRDTNDHRQVLESWEVNELVKSAHDYRCKLCDERSCKNCQLGKALDNLIAIDRDGGSWSMIDIGE